MAGLAALALAAILTGRVPADVREALTWVTARHAVQAAEPTKVVVRQVIDGDTIELDNGDRVRYIGVNTPESRRQVNGQWVERAQPYAKQAAAFNRRLVEGRRVRLAYDVERRDKYGRLLAYVYVAMADGETFVNAELVRQGYAQVMTIPPNVQHAEQFKALQREAREAKRGLWRSPKGGVPSAVEGSGHAE